MYLSIAGLVYDHTRNYVYHTHNIVSSVENSASILWLNSHVAIAYVASVNKTGSQPSSPHQADSFKLDFLKSHTQT